jgi:hypothetical protein
MFSMSKTIDTSIPQFGFQVSLLNLAAATAEAAGPSMISTLENPWKEESRKVESLIEQYSEEYVRVRRRKS